MRKILFIFLILLGCAISAQKNHNNIIESTNIKEIENFLRTAHPDDSRRNVLKSRLIALKNSQWMKPDNNSYRVTPEPLIFEIPKSVLKNKENKEAEEFKELVEKNSESREENTLKLLNELTNNDVSHEELVLLMQNNSDCNVIVRIQGEEYYNLAVPANGQNSVVIKKGEYQLNSNVCDAKYTSVKSITKSMFIILNKPIVTIIK